MASNNENKDSDFTLMDYGDGSTTDDNDSSKKIKRSSKTTPLQYQTMQKFMQTHMDFTKGKADDSQSHAWDELSADLNKIGPPFHSSIDWRRVWTDYKANQKRKGLTAMTVNDVQIRTMAVQHRNQSRDCLNDHRDKNSDSLLSTIYDKIETVEDKIDTFEVKLDAVVEQQTETNRLLKEVIDLLKPQSLNDADVI